MEKMETKALNALHNCKIAGRSLEKKFCSVSVMHKMFSGNIPGGAGMEGSSLWVRHHPGLTDPEKVHGKAGDGEAMGNLSEKQLNQLI